uniref:Uncharacterized protein n=1 Tax=Arundo donax TaxID=35708 RepID=A0A0A9AAW1_ARUDO
MTKTFNSMRTQSQRY